MSDVKVNLENIFSFDTLLSKCETKQEEQEVYLQIAECIATKGFTLPQYVMLFSLEGYSLARKIDEVVRKIESILRYCKKEKVGLTFLRGMHLEVERVKKYRSPYIFGDDKRLGYRDSETGEPVLKEITQEDEKLAQDYVQKVLKDQCCYENVHDVLKKIVKGEITQEDIPAETVLNSQIADCVAELKQAYCVLEDRQEFLDKLKDLAKGKLAQAIAEEGERLGEKRKCFVQSPEH